MLFSKLAIQNPYESQIGTPIFPSISKDQNVSLKNKKRGTFSKTDIIFLSSAIQFSFKILTFRFQCIVLKRLKTILHFLQLFLSHFQPVVSVKLGFVFELFFVSKEMGY